MEIKVWSKVWVKLLYLLTIPFQCFSCRFFGLQFAFCFSIMQNGLQAFKGVLEGQLYLVDFNDNQAELDTCLIAKTNMGWLWHR
jgi:hypothetical protein